MLESSILSKVEENEQCNNIETIQKINDIYSEEISNNSTVFDDCPIFLFTHIIRQEQVFFNLLEQDSFAVLENTLQLNTSDVEDKVQTLYQKDWLFYSGFTLFFSLFAVVLLIYF